MLSPAFISGCGLPPHAQPPCHSWASSLRKRQVRKDRQQRASVLHVWQRLHLVPGPLFDRPSIRGLLYTRAVGVTSLHIGAWSAMINADRP